MSGPQALHLHNYARNHPALKTYLRHPGDGRRQPSILAQTLVWALLIGQVLRATSFCRLEWLVRSQARRGMGVSRPFGDDALAYFTERLDPEVTRQALANSLKHAKRNKAFENSWRIGLAVDGAGAGYTTKQPCSLCHPVKDKQGHTCGRLHQFVMITVVGTGLTLPLDVEPYGPGDCEYNAGARLVKRSVALLGPRFADYLVVDGEFATAPFLHAAGKLGLPVVALERQPPRVVCGGPGALCRAPPDITFEDEDDRVELWDAADFDPWETLEWETVRVMRYRQHKRDGTVVEAYWHTNFSPAELPSRSFYRLAKSRWEIENQGFNDGNNRYGMEHIRHHEPNSLLVCWYHGIRSAIHLVDTLLA